MTTSLYNQLQQTDHLLPKTSSIITLNKWNIKKKSMLAVINVDREWRGQSANQGSLTVKMVRVSALTHTHKLIKTVCVYMC